MVRVKLTLRAPQVPEEQQDQYIVSIQRPIQHSRQWTDRTCELQLNLRHEFKTRKFSARQSPIGFGPVTVVYSLPQ